MSQVINTNILSIAAQNNLNKSQASLGTAIQRLSSGWRINSAKDDAAGQAIANRFTSLINGLTQASRNANDGIAVAQTAEGAINEINENLHAIRRLTVQVKSTATISEADKKSIQNEIGKRLDEIDRIAAQTEFNGVRILSKNQNLSIQVGANDGETVDIELKQLDTKELGIDTYSVVQVIKLSDIKIEQTNNVDNWVMPTIEFVGADAKKIDIDGKVYSKGSQYYVKKLGTEEYYKADVDDAVSGNAKLTYTATTATKLEGDAAKGINHSPQGVKSGTTSVAPPKGMTVHACADKSVQSGYILKGTDNGETVYYSASIDAKGKVTQGEKIEVSAEGKAATHNPLENLDKAIAKVDEVRGLLGATQNRLSSVINSLSTTVTNLSQSRSNILDADFAIEISNMNRANILQQAGTAVLAQANSVPQGVLSLLR
ncbi:flagellin [Sodalis-like endosymbiont of Proechinophthirus fluctus]|uniref:FliC/FljB family flagellin n=1 Tax=Sodalis-like endosymbiont of Proechinophthirus fluctus TaxID=1462730 RepID=UPI0007A7D77C|nr:FliC/FljB family flagellin [Sodalis-like endosymbiont of Proechinophthirus fluctus]KYP96951.1 flagellin [Sodalis-like endosymbiont of Proechinophthirus fluctus]